MTNDNCTDLTLKAKLLTTLAWRLAKAGAETRLIVQSIEQMQRTLNISGTQVFVNRQGVMIKIPKHNDYVLEFRQIENFGINMDSLTRLHQICLQAEKGQFKSVQEILHKVRSVRPSHYPKWLLIIMEGFAASAFSYLNGGDLNVAIAALMGGFVLMHSRFYLISRKYFELFAFMVSAFLGCSTTFFVAHFILHATNDEISLSIMATTLLLVPGFPYMNGFLDIFKGYIETGIIRLMHSIVLTISAAVGLLGALCLSHVLGA